MGLLIGVFLVLFIVVIAATLTGLQFYQQMRRKAITATLANGSVTGTALAADGVSVLQAKESTLRILGGQKWVQTAEASIQQAGISWTVPHLLIGSACGVIAGTLLGGFFPILVYPLVTRIAFAVGLAALPWRMLGMKKKKRLAAIEQDFPDALDFLGRS